MPLPERPSLGSQIEQHFPERLRSRLAEMKVAALTGLQLLGLFQTHRDGAEAGKRLLDELLETNGVFERVADWRQFLSTDQDGNT
jgi:hypothetical protein